MGGRGRGALHAARGWATGRSYREYGVGLGLAVLLVSGAFGGLEEDRPELPPTVAAGQRVDVEPFDVTVERVRVGTDLGVDSIPSPEGRYLLVSLRVGVGDLDASVPYGTLRDLVRLEGAQGLVPATWSEGAPVPPRPDEVPASSLVSSDDAELLGDIAPGLEYPAVFLFQQVASARVPDEVTVVLSRHQWRKSTIEERFGWFDPEPAVRVTVPVTEFAPAPDPSASPSPSPTPEPSS